MKQLYRLHGIFQRRIRIPIFLVLSFSFLLLLIADSHAQVNSYARVNSITTSGGRTTLNISNRNQTYHTFAVGEQVLVIQMQANIIGTNTGNNTNFGNLAAGGIGNTGFYDVATIYSLTGSTAITLTDVLANKFTFGTDNNVQVVSFQQLSATNFTTTTDIDALPWNGTIGGVVALQVPGTFTINHNITADGQGFLGGGRSSDYQDGACGSTTFTSSSTREGIKGEGIYLVNTGTNPTYVRGRGKILSGGGGGSQGNAGGGGGSNFSVGGLGGPGWSCTGSNTAGGLGGIDLSTSLLAGTRVFMGGGGGGGQGNNSEATAGGNGGGIIIIHAKTLTTGCTGTRRISANGSISNDPTGTGADGAGGAGAGGTILLHVGTFSVPVGCPLHVQANGGNGGSITNIDTHGGGGGGGQGAVIYALPVPTLNVITNTIPGLGGKNSSANGATSAGGGGNTAGAGIISGVGAVLPVRLIHFAAENINKKAVLNWTASDEANTSFTILHATDGVNFTPIGTVNGTGNGNTASNYTFTDGNAIAGKNYYQLLISGDVTTRITYSGIVSVNMNEEKSLATAWPNPAHDHFSIRVSNAYINKTHQIVITDLTGKLMYTNTYKPAGGIISVTPTQRLKPGMYIFKLTSEGYEQCGKLFIQ